MKSKEALEQIKYAPEFMGGNDRYKSGNLFLDDIEIIRKDLEVLEIIKNKEVDIKGIKLSYQGYLEGVFGTLEIALQSYNTNIKKENQLTLEEFKKIKQWLGEDK